MRHDPARLVRVSEDGLDGVDEQTRDLVGGCLPCADECPGDLRERVEARSLAVRKRVTLETKRCIDGAVQAGEELADEPALAHPRVAHDRQQLRRAFALNTAQRPPEQIELLRSTDEPRPDELTLRCRPQHECGPRQHGLGLSLHGNLRRLAVLDDVAGGTVRRLADENPARRRRSLQPRAGVHDVAGGHSLAGLGRGRQRNERLAGVDADADLERE